MFQAAKEGPRKGKVPPLDVMLADYYKIRGWDKDSNPMPETLKRLGLDKIVVNKN
jgi:aldehyde:ferredoxin oxidoreductase